VHKPTDPRNTVILADNKLRSQTTLASATTTTHVEDGDGEERPTSR
jgi:hypothetical protein